MLRLQTFFLEGADLALVLGAAVHHFRTTLDTRIAASGRRHRLPFGLRFSRFRAARHLGIIDGSTCDDLHILARLDKAAAARGHFDPAAAANASLIADLRAWRATAAGALSAELYLVDPEQRLRAALVAATCAIERIPEPA